MEIWPPGGQLPPDALRGRVAMVMQKAQLFGGTIRSICCGATGCHRCRPVGGAGKLAQAADFVRAKPLGLDEPVEQGGHNLSGGQKQRLTIARALVGKPDNTILDDSASALDYATDAAPAQGTGGAAQGTDRVHRQPARRQFAARRPDSGAG